MFLEITKFTYQNLPRIMSMIFYRNYLAVAKSSLTVNFPFLSQHLYIYILSRCLDIGAFTKTLLKTGLYLIISRNDTVKIIFLRTLCFGNLKPIPQLNLTHMP